MLTLHRPAETVQHPTVPDGTWRPRHLVVLSSLPRMSLCYLNASRLSILHKVTYCSADAAVHFNKSSSSPRADTELHYVFQPLLQLIIRSQLSPAACSQMLYCQSDKKANKWSWQKAAGPFTDVSLWLTRGLHFISPFFWLKIDWSIWLLLEQSEGWII